jgi:hypothetical protein
MKGYEYLLNFLREEGFKFNEEDSIISFKFEGNTYVAFKKDSSLLTILQICNADGHSRTELLEKCNEFNENYYIIKFTVHGSNIWCTYEFEPSEHTTSDDFSFCFKLIDKATDEILQEIS